MGVVVRIDATLDAARAIRRVQTIAARALDTKPASEAILADMRQMVSRQFATAGAYRGPKWKPLKAATVREKLASRDGRVRSNARRPLIATGEMRASLVDPRRLASGSTATREGVQLASRLKRTEVHHRGAPERGIPARPLIRITAQDRARHSRILLDHLVEGSA